MKGNTKFVEKLTENVQTDKTAFSKGMIKAVKK